MIMKRLVSALMVSAAFAAQAADSDYTAETGYVTLTSNDDRDKSSFYSVGRWSDGQDPHSGTNYYVGSQLQFYCDYNRTDDFAGDGIWVAGKVYHPGGWVNNVNCGPLHMLPDSWLTWRGVGGFAGGSMEILGTEANPAYIRFSTEEATKRSYAVKVPVSSAADAHLVFTYLVSAKLIDGKWILIKPDNHVTGATFPILGSWPDFCGTATVDWRHTVAPDGGTFSTPGTFVLNSESELSLTAASGESFFGGLVVHSNATFTMSANNTQVISIADRLQLDAGAKLNVGKALGGWTVGAPPTNDVFRLAAGAAFDEASLAAFPVARGTQSTDRGPYIPTCFWAVTEDAEGVRTVSQTRREVVRQTQSMNWSSNGFRSDEAISGQYWSDGKAPHPNADYLSDSGNVAVTPQGAYTTVGSYVFPGNSLTFYNRVVQIYDDAADLTGNFAFGAISEYAPQYNVSLAVGGHHLRGTICFAKMGGYATACKLDVWDGNTVHIHSDISGDGDVIVQAKNNHNTDYSGDVLSRGTLILSGDNSAFAGKWSVSCWQTLERPGWAKFFPDGYSANATNNVTVEIAGPTNLGGPLAAPAANALTLGNACRLSVTETADFDDLTRGWTFSSNAFVKVAAEKTVRVRNPVVLGGELVKEGNGCLCLGDLQKGADAPAAIRIEAGSLGALNAAAFNGIPLIFEKGAGLRVVAKESDPDLAARGFTYTADGSALAADGKIGIDYDLTGIDVENHETFSAAVMTVPSDQAASVAAKLSTAKPMKGYKVRLRIADNGDETSTIFCDIGEAEGTMLILR